MALIYKNSDELTVIYFLKNLRNLDIFLKSFPILKIVN